jgi:hypothetical protein
MAARTFESLREALPEGLHPDTVEKIRKATAHRRHVERVGEARAAACEWLRQNVDGSTTSQQACALLLAEADGLHGGECWDPGSGTTRHPAFRGLGSGRRHASDGGAWTRAIRDAAYQYCEEYGSPLGWVVGPVATEWRHVDSSSDGGGKDGVLYQVFPREARDPEKVRCRFVDISRLMDREELLTLIYRLIRWSYGDLARDEFRPRVLDWNLNDAREDGFSHLAKALDSIVRGGIEEVAS